MADRRLKSDPIELEVFRHLLASIAEEMGERLMRSAYSPNIKERRDFSCALFAADGSMLAQAAHIPVHLGAMQLSVEAILGSFTAVAMTPGQRFVVNDPFSGGTHLPDITVVAPVYINSAASPSFFVANRAHHADVGGISAGSMPLSRTIDDEGIRILPAVLTTKLFDAICSASRTPDERRGDLQAQLAALESGQQRLQALCTAYGAEHVSQTGAALQDYAARIMADVIGRITPGEYTFADLLDDDGLGTAEIRIACCAVVEASRITFDFSRSDPQCAGPLNAVRAITLSAVNYAMRCLAPADLPTNSGIMRNVDVVTRPGTIVDALPPAAVAAGNVETSQRITDVVFGVLAQALPELIPAASQGTMNNITIGGTDPRTGQPFTYYETIGGGTGAGPGCGGESAVHSHMTNTLNTPVEALEHAYPFVVEEYAIRSGTGGGSGALAACRHTGGNGLVRRIRVLGDADVTLLTERRTHRPWGLDGGEPGQAGANRVIRSTGEVEALPSKCTLQLKAGDTIEIATPGGGGWGRTGRSLKAEGITP